MKKILTIFILSVLTLFVYGQDDCYRIKGTDSLQLSANGLPTTLCMGTPVNVGMATIISYYHEIKKGDVPVKSGEGNGGALSFETTALSAETGGNYQALSTKYGCPTLLTNKVILTYQGIRTQVLSGGGLFCQGNPGITLHLDSSETGVSYQLYMRGTNDPDEAVGNPVAGNGSPINFPPVNTAGSYYVRASSPTCILDIGSVSLFNVVSGMMYSNLTNSSVLIKWRSLANVSGYEYAVTTSSTPPSSGTNVADTFVQVNSLTGATNYYVHVRANCSGGGSGDWVSLPFTTNADAFNCNASRIVQVCTSDSIVLPAGSGAWNFAGASPNNSNGYSTPGREEIIRFTPSVTGYYQMNVFDYENYEQINYLIKAASGGCTNSGWTGVGTVTGTGKLDLGNLQSGITYYIVADRSNTVGTAKQFFNICQYTSPCQSVTALQICTAVTANFTSGEGVWNFAGIYPNNSVGFSTYGKELVYSFIPATSGYYYVDITAVTGSAYIDYLFKPASGGCSSKGWTGIDDRNSVSQVAIGNLTAGVQYFLVLDLESSCCAVAHTFKICKADPPSCTPVILSNCATATITIGPGIGGWDFAGTAPNNSSGYATPGKEILYSFMPPVTGNYGFEITSTTGGYVSFLFKNASSGCNATGWTGIGSYISTGVVSLGTLQNGQQYYLLIDRETTTGSITKTFKICKIDPPQCSASTALTLCTAMTAAIPVGGGAWDSIRTGPFPTYTVGKELMYSFTPSVRGLYYLHVSAASGTLQYWIKAAASGCTPTGWKYITSTYSVTTALIDTLEAGVQHYILLDNEQFAYSANHTFKICMVPVRTCSSPAVITECSPVSGTLDPGIGAWNIGDTISVGTVTNYGFGLEKMYSFIPPVSGHYNFGLTSLSGNYYPSVKFNIKNAATGCNEQGWKTIGSFYSIGSKVINDLQAGVTYYIMADNTSKENNAIYTFSLCRVELTSCASATAISLCAPVIANFAQGNGVLNFDGRFPGNSVGYPTPGRELFYKFTPALTALYYIELLSTPAGESISYLYKASNGSCTNTGWTGFARFDQSTGTQMRIGKLQAGVEYIFVLDNETTNGANQTFRICKTDFPDCATAVAAGFCQNNTAVIPAGYGSIDQVTFNSNKKGFFTPGKELIYSFTPSVTSSTAEYYIQVISASGGYVDYYFKAASLGCDTSNWIRAGEFNSPGVANIGHLTNGVTYYIMLDNETTVSNTQVFTICRWDPQNCASSPVISACTPLTFNVTSGIGAWDFAGTFPVNSTGIATPGRELVCRFTPAVSGMHYIDFTSASGTGILNFFYKAAASGCNNTGWTGIAKTYTLYPKNFGPLQAGVEYYILADNENTAQAPSVTFRICAAPTPLCTPAPEVFEETQAFASINSGVGGWDFTNNVYGTSGLEIFFKFKPTRNGSYFIKHLTGDPVLFQIKKSTDPCTANAWTNIGHLSAGQEGIMGTFAVGEEYIIMADNSGLGSNSFSFIITSGMKVCPGENLTFTMHELNSGGNDTYSWQVDKGLGFVAISDNQFYSGTSTYSLSITNPPTSFYNYRYRGIAKAVGGFGSFTETTDFKPIRITNNWIGATADWHDPGNWSCSLVPDLNTDVIIPAGTTFTPVVTSNTTIRSLSVKQGGGVKVNSGVVMTVRGK